MIKDEFNAIRREYGIFVKVSADEYIWNNLFMRFGETYYTIVRGKIPYELAYNIYSKYPNDAKDIRVAGSSSDLNEWATDDICEQEKDKLIYQEFVGIISTGEMLKGLKDAIAKCSDRSNEDKYVKSYHIDTKRGLCIFLNEVLDYYSKNKKEENSDEMKLTLSNNKK